MLCRVLERDNLKLGLYNVDEECRMLLSLRLQEKDQRIESIVIYPYSVLVF